MKTKVTKDGFVWLIVDKDTATAIYKTGTQELYSLYDDDAEGLIESDEDFERALRSSCPFGVEVGYIKDLLPTCTKCGNSLFHSPASGYMWRCNKCDEDYTSNEI